MKSADSLFTPIQIKSLKLKNRFVMAPMTRSFSPNGIPTDDVTQYYTRRAGAEVGLILSEGTVIDRVASSNDPNIPRFHGAEPLKAWSNVIASVHQAGGKMGPQIWHMGMSHPHRSGWLPAGPFEGPSGLLAPDKATGAVMTEADIQKTIEAYATAAGDAKRLGFDCVELHGAHGYLIDQFFWEGLNKRTDQYGGKTIAARTRFAVDVVKAVRQQVGPDFPVILRLSQWKSQDYTARNAQTPQEMESWLAPLASAGVDVFHCSQRRFWEPEFEGSDLNFAGWAKKLTGKVTITVGSIGLDGEFIKAFKGESSQPASIDNLIERFEKNEFDLVAIGRPLLSDYQWVQKIKEGRFADLKGFSKDDLGKLF